MRNPVASRTTVARGGGLFATLALAISAAPAVAAGDDASLRLEMKRLAERLEQVERHNRELEQRLSDVSRGRAATGQPDAGATVEQRLRALENAKEQTESSLASERLSENEPELVTRLKAVETQTLAMQKQARQIEALEGITVSANMLTVAQRVDSDGSSTGKSESRLNYRGDVSVTLPGGSLGDADGKIFAHLRFGQGNGVGLRPTYTSTPNTTTFESTGVQNSDSSFAILAQAWYQLDVPLPLGGFKPYSRQRISVSVGKIDPFIFFDQNVAADDESVRFTNNAFVHNPLLDSGGDTGSDAYGFAPGVRVAYANETNRAHTWGVSFGAFGAGPAANYSGSFSRPFLIGQLEMSTRLVVGLPGNYRLYMWRNDRAEDFDGTIDGHSGWGISADQRVGDALTVFARFGDRTAGRGSFDRAFTVGAEIGGNYWRRGADALGLAFGLLHTNREYRAATADGSLVGYAASNSEQVAELYYRYRLNDHVEITPDLQFIRRPGGAGDAPGIMIVGLRAQVGF